MITYASPGRFLNAFAPTLRLKRARWALLILLGWAGLGSAATPETAGGLAPTPLPDAGISLLRVSGALALVVGLFLGGVWLFKNWQRLLLKNKGAPKLNVIEVRPLGGRHALYLIGYDQQRMLLAASPSGVQFVSHLPDAEPSENPMPPSTFSGLLDRTQTRTERPIPASKEVT